MGKFLKYFLLIVVIVYIGACYKLAKDYVSPERGAVEQPPKTACLTKINGLDHQIPIWATKGIYQKQPNSNIVFVLVHGYTSNRKEWYEVYEGLIEKGYEAICPALRAHEDNLIETSTFGKQESQEVIDVVKWIRSQYPPIQKPYIVVVGHSMGGSATWLASEKEPHLIDAIVSQAAYSNFEATSNAWLDKRFKGAHIVLKPVVLFSEWMAGAKQSEIDTLTPASKWKGKPALIVQGMEDNLLVPDDAKKLADASQGQLWMIPEKGHSYAGDKGEYLNKIISFAESSKVLSEKNNTK